MIELIIIIFIIILQICLIYKLYKFRENKILFLNCFMWFILNILLLIYYILNYFSKSVKITRIEKNKFYYEKNDVEKEINYNDEKQLNVGDNIDITYFLYYFSELGSKIFFICSTILFFITIGLSLYIKNKYKIAI